MKALRIFLEITIGLLVLPFEAIRIIRLRIKESNIRAKRKVPMIRILISDDHWRDFVSVEAQEFKRKYFWSNEDWVTICGMASHKDDVHGMLKSCIRDWSAYYPQSEIINTSTRYTYHIKKMYVNTEGKLMLQ